MTFQTSQQNILPEELEQKVRAAEAWLHEKRSEIAKAEELKLSAEQASTKAREEHRALVSNLEKEIASLVLLRTNALKEKSDIEGSIQEAKSVLISLNNNIDEAKRNLAAVLKEFEDAKPQLEAAKSALVEKEKTLGVYSNALKLKEDKVAQYLRIFEKMSAEIKI